MLIRNTALMALTTLYYLPEYYTHLSGRHVNFQQKHALRFNTKLIANELRGIHFLLHEIVATDSFLSCSFACVSLYSTETQ